jgi:hypothetical protein
MLVSRPLTLLLALLVCLISGNFRLRGWQARNNAPLSVDEVVRLSQAGFSEDVIITKIKKNGKPFDLNTDELLDLKKAGVSDSVIKYLLDPSQPYSPPAPPPVPPPPVPAAAQPEKPSAPPPPPVPVKQYPKDTYASKVPAEPGLYRFTADSPARVELKLLLGVKEGPGLGKVFMKKGNTIAYLAGPASATRTREPAPRFYIRLPEGKGIEDMVLIDMDRKSGRREIGMGAGPKPEFKPEAIRPFEWLEVGPQLFRVTTGKLAKGEYLFFLMGSAEPPKGTYGKGYDFGVD